jgi:hypothetical protein
MARLCILREDLFIELRGMVDDPLPGLDECSISWRQIYFYRNLVRTVQEIRKALHEIECEKAFKAELGDKLPQVHEALDTIGKMFSDSHAEMKKIRNEFGGHINSTAIAEGLHRIAADTKGLFQAGLAPVDIHYKFAIEFVGAAMLRQVPLASAEAEWDRIFSVVVNLAFEALRGIDTLFDSYVHIRKLSRD